MLASFSDHGKWLTLSLGLLGLLLAVKAGQIKARKPSLSICLGHVLLAFGRRQSSGSRAGQHKLSRLRIFVLNNYQKLNDGCDHSKFDLVGRPTAQTDSTEPLTMNTVSWSQLIWSPCRFPCIVSQKNAWTKKLTRFLRF